VQTGIRVAARVEEENMSMVATPQLGVDRRRRAVALATAVVLGVALVASGCSGSESADSSTTTAPANATTSNPYGDAPAIDPPAPDEVVLTVTGPAGTAEYTLEQLRQRATTKLTVDEPFVKQRIEFAGVPMAELLQAAGLTGDQQVNTIALNNYKYAAPASVFTASNGMLAVTQAGGDIPIAQGGPIRIVFPDGTPGSSNLDAWNWSLDRIEPA